MEKILNKIVKEKYITQIILNYKKEFEEYSDSLPDLEHIQYMIENYTEDYEDPSVDDIYDAYLENGKDPFDTLYFLCIY